MGRTYDETQLDGYCIEGKIDGKAEETIYVSIGGSYQQLAEMRRKL